MKDKYNEIYTYLINKKAGKEGLPNRLYDSILIPNPSTRHKKRANFRKDANENYLLNDENRLCYKFRPKTNKNIKNKQTIIITDNNNEKNKSLTQPNDKDKNAIYESKTDNSEQNTILYRRKK